MLLWELYQEEDDSTVTHNNQLYDLNKLFATTEHFNTRIFNIKDLKWILKYSKPDPERIDDADPSVPIIVAYSNKKLVVIDGLHRLVKAIENGTDTIEGKFVYKDVLEKCKIR